MAEAAALLAARAPSAAGPSVAERRDRIASIDAAKAIGIVLVCSGHVERGLFAAGIVDSSTWIASDFTLYTFHMPLFFFLSGLTMRSGLDRSFRMHLVSKARALLLPYFVWSVLQTVAMIAVSREVNHHISVATLLSIAWHPVWQFWFLYVLFVYSVAVSLVSLHVLWIIAIVAFAAGEVSSGGDLVHQMLHFLLFVAAGATVARTRWISTVSGGVAAVGMMLSAVTVIGGLVGGIDQMPTSYNSALMLPAAAGGIVVVVYAAQCASGSAAVCRLGQMSLVIYVMHVIAAAAVRIVMQKVLHIPLMPAVYMFVCLAAAICLPLIAYRMFAFLGAEQWLGLPRYTRDPLKTREVVT